MEYAQESLAIFGGPPMVGKELDSSFPVSEAFFCGLKDLIENKPLSTLFGEGEVQEFEGRFALFAGTKHAVAVNSGTSSLHTALCTAGITAGDDVAVTSFSFIASASVIRQVGANPVFIDIDRDTLAIDLADLKKRITPKTKAVIVAHLFGIPSDIVELRDFCRDNNLILIEDACQALGATVDNTPIGSFGDIGCFSFNVKKIIQTGEGGMLVTNDDAIADAARELRVNGLSVFGAERLGFNYTLTNLQAYLGMHQLALVDNILETRRKYANKIQNSVCKYARVFSESRRNVIRSPYAVPFELAVETPSQRDFIIAALHEEGVPVSGVYSVLYHHTSVFGEYSALPCHEAERTVPKILSINPSHLYSEKDVDLICIGIEKVLSNFEGLLEASETRFS